MATTQAEHRAAAEHLLGRARLLAFTDPARNAHLAEAQVHALLAITAPVEVKAPARPRKATPAKDDAK